MRVVVVKVGGSLLTLPDLAARLEGLLESIVGDAGVCPLFVCGGGAAADLVREWSGLHALGTEESHWMALRAMMLNEALLVDLLPNATGASTAAGMQAAWAAGQIPILCAFAFLREAEPSTSLELPHTWDATSDSVAAWVAVHFQADELILVKSTDLPAACDAAEAARQGLVDAAFGRYVPRLRRIRWTNLRSDTPALRTWPVSCGKTHAGQASNCRVPAT